MTDAIFDWVQFAREVEIHKAGNAQGLIDWYNNGADGQINWGSEGDFDACVAIAGKHLDNPEGFCQLRHIDATGEPAGKAPSEITKADEVNYERLIGNQKGEPTNVDLYEKVKAEAKAKFDVYPSAVANGWVVQEYKRRGGTYVKPVSKTDYIRNIFSILRRNEITKGDVTGHEFHGNQYTEGQGGGTSTMTSERPKGGEPTRETYRRAANEIAGFLHDRAIKTEPQISREIDETCQQFGGTRVKPEFVLKDEESIQRKLIADATEYLDNAKGQVETAGENLGDAVRYTIKFPTESFGGGVTKSLADFKSEGFEALKIKNFYNDDPQNSYRGINCVFRDTTTNQKFEVQFHTPESSAMTEAVHPIYEATRVLDKGSQEYADGQAKMIAMWQTVPTPSGLEGIGKISVKKSAQVLYFYDFTHPEVGATGTATLENGKFTTYTGDGEFWVSNERRLTKSVIGKDATDQEIYDSLNGWSDGQNFCVDAPKTWTV